MLIVITGAAGRIGRVLAAGLARPGRTLRLLDVVPPPTVPPGSEASVVDVSDLAATIEALRGADAVVHMAGIPDEAPFPEVLAGNVTTTWSVLEAARVNGVRRVVLASSNHAAGMYPRTHRTSPDDPVRPDGFYGVTKVATEALGRLYVEKHGLQVACLRIGSFEERPRNDRHLATWLSHGDTVRLCEAALTAPGLTYRTVYGTSRNTRRFWSDEGWAELGYQPVDNGEQFVGTVPPPPTELRAADLLQGGDMVEVDYAGGMGGDT